MPDIQRITWISETGSTNDLARDDFLETGRLWHCFVADSQTKGRGRRGQSWASPAGTGLYLSIAVPRPGILEAWLPLTCAIASSRAIQSVVTKFYCPKGIPIKIKWPNDLYIRDKKIAGILCELTGEHKRGRAWIIGIGINVNTPRGTFPEGLQAKAGSISSAIGTHVSRKVLLDELLLCLSPWLGRLYKGDASGIWSFLEKTEIVGINSGSGTEPQMQIGRLQSPDPMGITMGCPAGIGPEIIIKAFASNPEWSIAPQSVVIGDMNVLERASKVLGINIPIRPWSPGDPLSSPGVYVYAVTNLDPSDIPWGEPSPLTGRASLAYIAEGIKLCQAGSLSGLVTAPISKLGLRLAGIHFRDGVNVTQGLPIVRTSVDHGTAYDIAGTGRADCASLEAAVNLAAEMVANRLRR